MAFSISSRRRFAAVLLGALPVLAGCGILRDTLIASFPDAKGVITPILGTPKPSPFTIPTGNLRGRVVSSGKPVVNAVVTVGSETYPVASPPETKTAQVKSSAEETDDGLESVDGLPYYVMFRAPGDSAEAPHERRLRKYPACDASGPGGFRCKYVYLKRGEYLIEDLPEGQAPLRAIAGGQQSPITLVVVRPGVTIGPFELAVSDTASSGGSSSGDVHSVKWQGFVEDLVTGTMDIKTDDSGKTTYEIAPSEVTIRLAAPPGSQGVTLRRYGVSYEYTDPDTGELQSTGEVTLPMPPLEILPSQSDGAGREATLKLSTNNALVTSKLVPNILNASAQLRVGAFIVRYRFFSTPEAPDSTSGSEDTSVIKDETGGELVVTLGVNVTKAQ